MKSERLKELLAKYPEPWVIEKEPHNYNDGTKEFTHVRYVGSDRLGSPVTVSIGEHVTPDLAELLILLRESAEQTDDEDTRDALFFRLWIRLAEKSPGRCAKALARCIHEDAYRDAIETLALEEGLSFPASTKKLMASFILGTRIQHMNGCKGTVTNINDGGAVCVTFDEGDGRWKGEYPESWFKLYPKGLSKIVE